MLVRTLMPYCSFCSVSSVQGCSLTSPWHSSTCSGEHSSGFSSSFSGCWHLFFSSHIINSLICNLTFSPPLADTAEDILTQSNRQLAKTALGRSAQRPRDYAGTLVRYLAMSLRALRGRTLTTFRAGLAAKTCSCLVNGLMPFRLGVAGL